MPVATSVQVGNSYMTLHCGGQVVSRGALNEVVPPATRTWQPIPHKKFFEEVERELKTYNCTIKHEHHALAGDGARYFGLLGISTPSDDSSFEWCLGLRNSHDKSMAAQMVLGSRVFVCDNLAFHADVQFKRKHSGRLLDHITGDILQGLGVLLNTHIPRTKERFDQYRAFEVPDSIAHEFLIKALIVGALPPSKIMTAVHEWRRPTHEEFKPRTLWSLYNCCTATQKNSPPGLLTTRTQRLQGLADIVCRINDPVGQTRWAGIDENFEACETTLIAQ